MDKLRSLVRSELSGWKTYEVCWLVGTCGAVALLALGNGDNALNIAAAVTGLMCSLLTGKGKLSAYVVGLSNVLIFMVISYQAKFYGTFMLNAFYYLPAQFWGFYSWSKHMNAQTHEVCKRWMTAKMRALATLGVVVGTAGYGYCLSSLRGAQPWLDAFITVVSVITLVVGIKRFAEQWLLWFVADLVSVFMWYESYRAGQAGIAIVLMWLLMTINALLLYIRWAREIRRTS